MEASTGNLNPFLWIKKKCLLSWSNEVNNVNKASEAVFVLWSGSDQLLVLGTTGGVFELSNPT